MLKKLLTSLIILLVVLPTFPVILPKVEAVQDEVAGLIEAENSDRVKRIGGDFYVGDPDEQGWMEYKQYIGSEKMCLMYTIGQHKEELQLDFSGWALNITFYCFRSGIARVVVCYEEPGYPGYWHEEFNKTADTYGGDNDVSKKLVFSIPKLEYRRHRVRVIATGSKHPHSSAEYIYLDNFIIPGLYNVLPIAQILNITPNPVTRGSYVCFNGSGTDPDGSVILYEWDFDGDGKYEWKSTKNGIKSKTYENAGTYYPKLRVTDNKGAEVEERYTMGVVVNPLPPDLQISASGISFLYSGKDIIITAEVHNGGEQDAGYFEVEFIDTTLHQSVVTVSFGSGLAAGSTTNATCLWVSPVAGHRIKVKVDPDNDVQELSEANNEESVEFVGNEPVVNKITTFVVKDSSAHYVTDSNRYGFTGVRDINVKTRFVAAVSDANGLDTIKNVTFKLNGKIKCVDTAAPFQCEFDIGTDNDVYQGSNTLTAVAIDNTGLVSNTASVSFEMIEIPDWLVSIGTENLDFSFDTSTMTYKIEFSYEILSGTGECQDDPINKGKDAGITDFTVKFSVAYSMRTNTATLSGGGDLGLKLLGYEPKVGVEISGELSQTLALVSAKIEVNVEIELPSIPVAGIVIPLPDPIGEITIGVVIEGSISVSVTAEFKDKSGKFELDTVSVTVTGKAEGKFELSIPPLCGVYGGVYAQVTLTGQNVKPNISVTVEVGIEAGGYIDNKEWPWKMSWSYTVESDPQYVSKEGWKSMPPGGNLSYGENTVVDDVSRQDSPSVASDSRGNTIAVWTQNMSLSATNVYFSIWNGSTWSKPATITNDSYYKMTPVIAFDSNNNAIVTWTQANKPFNSSSNMSDYFAATPNFEIFYSIWDGSNWAQPRPITNTTDVAMEFGPAIAADRSGKVMAVWTHDYDGNMSTRADRDIYYSVWNGSSWTTPSAACNLAELDSEPSVAYDSQGNAMIAWVHDNNSTTSTFDDAPPDISNATVAPDPAYLFNPVEISAKVTEYMGLYRVYANVTDPYGSVQTINLEFDMGSRLYGGQYVPRQIGIYNVQLVAEDVFNQTDTTLFTFQGINVAPPPTVDRPPLIVTADATTNLLYSGQPIAITAQVKDDRGISEVYAEIIRPDGTPEIMPLLGPYPMNGTYQKIYLNTYLPGVYLLHVLARDTGIPPNPLDFCSVVVVVRPRNINNEVYYATWNGNVWSNPTIITNPNDFSESYKPSVAYDIWRNAIIVWTEYNGSAYKIYHYVISNFAPFGTPKPLPDAGGNYNLDPVIKTTPTGIAIITWRATPSDGGDLYCLMINSTRYVMEAPEYTMLSTIRRITRNTITDWKHSVTIDSKANLLVTWLKHRTMNVGNHSHPDITFDDDDIYYDVIWIGAPDLEVAPSDINLLTASPNPRVGDTIDIRAMVHNTGTFDLRNINVDFYDRDPLEGGTLIGNRLIPLLRIGENATATVTWNATFGNHEIFVVVDRTNQILENNEKNNIAFQNILISTIPGGGEENLHFYIGNVTLRHSDTLSLTVGETVEVVFNGTGADDNIITEGNAILPTVVDGKVKLIPQMPSTNITLSHDSPASLQINNSSVTATLSWLGVNDQTIIPAMPTTGNVVLNHTTPAYLLVTNDTVQVTFASSSLDEAMLPWMDTYVETKHLNTSGFTAKKVPDPKLGAGHTTEKGIGKFINITALDTFEWAIIKIYYKEAELNGTSESNLRMHCWNTTTQEWTVINDSAVNAAENYVWANVTRFSVFTAIEAITEAHDVAATNVRPVKTVVGQACNCTIIVTIANQGRSREVFNITLYANSTSIALQVVALESATSTDITFRWNTTGFARGNHSISVYAWPVQGETDIGDNTFIYRVVRVSILGDINADGKVNILDIYTVARAFGSRQGEGKFEPNADINEDGIINILDIFAVAREFGKTA